MAGGFGDPHEDDDFRNDELVRIAAIVMDPLYGKPVPPPRVAAADIIHRARARRRTRRLAAWMLAAPALAAVVVAVTLAVAVLVPPETESPPAAQSSTPAAQATSAGQVPQPLTRAAIADLPAARSPLTRLADTVAATPGPNQPGRYTYTRVWGWSIDTTAAGPVRVGTARDEQRWWATDRAGRQVTTTRHGSAAVAPVADGRNTDVVNYPPGHFPVVIDSPSAQVPVLASQLAGHEDFTTGPQAALRAVRELYRFHALDAAHRAAALQVLADTDGLRWAGAVDGGPDLHGVAVVVDSDNGATRDIAVFHPGNGRLLAYQSVALRSPPRSHLTTPAVTDLVVFTAAGRTDRLGQPAPG
jgi:hypothetical protein